MAMADYDLSDLAAVVGNRNGNGDGMFNNGEGLLWLLFILILGGGWNRGWGGGGYGGGAGAVGGGALYPWMNLQQNFTEILQSLCGGFAGVTAAVTNGFANAETAATNRAMDQMQQNFALQTAMLQGFNAQQAQLASCCCENRLAVANLSADIAREACATRQNQDDNTQVIMSKLTQLEMDGYQRELAAERRTSDQLRQQLAQANLAASQIAQDARIIDGVYNRFAQCPVGTTPVYGQTPIFTCNNNGCGCGCNGCN